MLGTIGGQFDILERLRTSTVAGMFLKLDAERVRVIRAALTMSERFVVAARLRAEGFEAAAEVVLA